MDSIRARLEAFRTWFQELESTRRLWFLAIVGLGLVGLVVAWEMATYTPMVPLYERAQDPATSSEILSHLAAANVPYEIERGTDRILVPDTARDQLRMELSGGGLIDDKGVGLELFEDNRFGSTKFVEHVRYVRGLQGEIERQINSFEAVRGSKVLLSIPEQALFQEDAEDPSAAVYLELKSGQSLSRAEGERMASLVAKAVPRLSADAVAIMDSNMRVIHAANETSPEGKAASTLADIKKEYESYYKTEIERILERVVGPGKVVARVNVEVESTQQYLRERKLHGEDAVAVSTETQESNKTGRTEGGVPGTAANVQGAAVAAGAAGEESSSVTERGNFDVPETLREQSSLPGHVKSVTAAVLIDGTWAAPVAAEGEEAPAEDAEPVYTPRTDEEIANFKQIVASGLGISAEGVTIVNQQFAKVDVPKIETSALSQVGDPRIQSYVRLGFAFVALLLTFGFIVRPVMNNVLVEPEKVEPEKPVAELEENTDPDSPFEPDADDPVIAQTDALAALIERLRHGQTTISRQDISSLVYADPTHSVVTLQAWLDQDTES